MKIRWNSQLFENYLSIVFLVSSYGCSWCQYFTCIALVDTNWDIQFLNFLGIFSRHRLHERVFCQITCRNRPFLRTCEYTTTKKNKKIIDKKIDEFRNIYCLFFNVAGKMFYGIWKLKFICENNEYSADHGTVQFTLESNQILQNSWRFKFILLRIIHKILRIQLNICISVK